MLFPRLPIVRYPVPDDTLPVVVYLVYPSIHRLTGLPLGRFYSYGFHVVIGDVHRIPCILLTCPARVHSRRLSCSITSVTFVVSLSQMFDFQSSI